jgi:hypothetical protein
MSNTSVDTEPGITVIEDERGIFGPDERDQAHRIGMRIVTPRTFSYTASDRNYLKEGWEHEDRINRITEGSEADQPTTTAEAVTLIRERFGCVFRYLPENLRRNPDIMLAATVESSGHALKHAPQDAVEQLPPAFFVEAMRAGARNWILNLPGVSDAVKNDAGVRGQVEEQNAAARRVTDSIEKHQ